MELKARCKERFEPVVQAIRQLQKEKEGLEAEYKKFQQRGLRRSV